MIQQATQADVPGAVSRRRFLSMLTGGTVSTVLEPKKTFAFFGNILRPRQPEDWFKQLTTGQIIMAGAGIFGALLMGGLTPIMLATLQGGLKGEPFNASQYHEALSKLRADFPGGEETLQDVAKDLQRDPMFLRV
jgi:hypothetical protein